MPLMSQVWCRLWRVHHELDPQRRADGRALLTVDAAPVHHQQRRTQHQVKRHRSIGHQHIGAGGIVALRCLRVSQRQEEIAQLRQSHKGRHQKQRDLHTQHGPTPPFSAMITQILRFSTRIGNFLGRISPPAPHHSGSWQHQEQHPARRIIYSSFYRKIRRSDRPLLQPDVSDL